MQESASPQCSADTHRETLRRRMLTYGFVASIIGLPIGILLGMPVVWGLSIAGIVVRGIQLWLLRRRDQQASSNQQVNRSP
jgi:hypothetical protein